MKPEKNLKFISFKNLENIILSPKDKKTKIKIYNYNISILKDFKKIYEDFISLNQITDQYILMEERVLYLISFYTNTYFKLKNQFEFKNLNLELTDTSELIKSYKLSSNYFSTTFDQYKLIDFILKTTKSDISVKKPEYEYKKIKYKRKYNSTIYVIFLKIFFIKSFNKIKSIFINLKKTKNLQTLCNTNKNYFSNLLNLKVSLYKPNIDYIFEDKNYLKFLNYILYQIKKLHTNDENYSYIRMFYSCILFVSINLKNYNFNNDFYNNNVFNLQKYLIKKNIKRIFLMGGEFKEDLLLLIIAGKKLKVPIFYFQNGGRQLSYVGYSEDTEYIRNYKLFDRLFLSTHSNFFDKEYNVSYVQSLNFFNIRRSIKKSSFKKKIKILLIPLSLNDFIYTIEFSRGIHSDDFVNHNKFIINCLKSLNELSGFEIELYIKLKSNFYYEGFKELLTPNFDQLGFKLYYFHQFDASDSINYFDIILTSSSSTTFSKSLYANKPTILLFDQSIFEINKKFKTFYEKLKKVQIIVDNTKEFKKTFISSLEIDDKTNEYKKLVTDEYLNYFASINNKLNLEHFYG